MKVKDDVLKAFMRSNNVPLDQFDAVKENLKTYDSLVSFQPNGIGKPEC